MYIVYGEQWRKCQYCYHNVGQFDRASIIFLSTVQNGMKQSIRSMKSMWIQMKTQFINNTSDNSNTIFN